MADLSIPTNDGQSEQAAESLITKHIDIWTTAIERKSSAGRGTSNKFSLYGIKKLRELILELAVRGKLVPHSIAKCEYDFILKEMANEKATFHSQKGVRLQKFKPIVEEFFLPTIPESWKEVYFDQVITYITDFQANGSFSSLKQNVRYYDEKNYALLVRLTDLRHGLSDNSAFKFTDKTGYDFLAKSSIEGGELVVANVGAGVGTTLEIPEIGMPATLAPNMFMIVLSKLISKQYFLLFSKSPIYQKYIEKVNSGTGQPKINKTEYKNCKLSLPPLEEQHRIVAKVDELMSLCDALEAQTEASISAHQTLVETLLKSLIADTSGKTAMDGGNVENAGAIFDRVAEHFDTLFTTEASIDTLKQTILQLAVMGKLVPQDDNDESATKLLERIAAEKAQLIKDGKIKKQKQLPAITDEEKPFELPKGWEWCRFDDTALSSSAGWSPQCIPTPREGDNWGVLKVSAVTWGQYNPEENKELPSHLEPRLEHEVQSGDFLISRANTADLVAKAVVVPELTPKNLMMSDKIIRFKLHGSVSGEYLNLMNNSQVSRDYYNRVAGGTSSSMKNVSREHIRSLVVALPPLEEQHHIVARVEELMALCDQLKARLSDAQTTQLHLTDAIVEQAI